MELRNRAEEYKRRAQGTHFSRYVDFRRMHPISRKMTSWRLTCWLVKLWRCKMMSLVNKSAHWTSNYHKILIFPQQKSWKSLHAARIDELADSNEPAAMGSSQLTITTPQPYISHGSHYPHRESPSPTIEGFPATPLTCSNLFTSPYITPPPDRLESGRLAFDWKAFL